MKREFFPHALISWWSGREEINWLLIGISHTKIFLIYCASTPAEDFRLINSLHLETWISDWWERVEREIDREISGFTLLTCLQSSWLSAPCETRQRLKFGGNSKRFFGKLFASIVRLAKMLVFKALNSSENYSWAQSTRIWSCHRFINLATSST